MISAIVPCKGENHTIKEVTRDIKDYVSEVIVVYSGLNPDVVRSLEKEGVKCILDRNPGKGHAMRLGVSCAKGEIILFFDSDGSHRPEEVPLILSPILEGRASMVIGSRLKGHSDEYYGSIAERTRLFGNMLMTKMINIMWNAHLTDSQNGLRAIKREVFEHIRTKEGSFAIEQEMTIKCLKLNMRIAEVPSYELRRKHGNSNLNPFVMLPQYVLCLLREMF
jgi:glycosyltransferase involved in cell wall biosynthesis